MTLKISKKIKKLNEREKDLIYEINFNIEKKYHGWYIYRIKKLDFNERFHFKNKIWIRNKKGNKEVLIATYCWNEFLGFRGMTKKEFLYKQMYQNKISSFLFFKNNF